MVIENHPVAAHVNLWLERQLSGCDFASKLAHKHLILWGSVEDEIDVEDSINSAIRAAIEQGTLAGFVFPTRCTGNGIAEILAQLKANDSWRVSSTVTGYERPGTTSFAVGYRPAEDAIASAVGFAPLDAMPITRRAPVTALVVWAGPPRAGYLGSKKPNRTGLADSPVDAFASHDTEALKQIHRNTQERVRPLLGEDVPPLDGPDPAFSHLRNLFDMTFCVPTDAASAAGLLESTSA